MQTNIDQKIEAILFWKGEPVSIKKLAQFLNTNEEEIKTGISSLKEKLQNRGVSLIENDGDVMLTTNGECSEIVESIAKEELQKDLGKASIETLSIILYQGPIRRSEIDYVRGVNSQFILRNLLVRGLIEKEPDPKDARTFLYKPSFELLAHLNLQNVSEMPEYEIVRKDIESFKEAKNDFENKDKSPETQESEQENKLLEENISE